MSVFGMEVSQGGGNFLPIVKYDARAGRLFRVDRVQGPVGWEKHPHDVTQVFKAVFDFDNLEVGYINFPKAGAPQFALVPYGTPLPPKPSQEFKSGVRFLVKLDGATAGGSAAVREVCSNAGVFLTGTHDLFQQYEAQRAANPGKLPIVRLQTTKQVASGESTNYAPVWEITGWAPRPADLTPQPRGISAPAAPAAAAFGAPPATGSTLAPPPAQQPAMAGADDFG